MIVPAVKRLICPQRTLNSVRVLKLTYTTQYPGNKPCVSDSMDSVGGFISPLGLRQKLCVSQKSFLFCCHQMLQPERLSG